MFVDHCKNVQLSTCGTNIYTRYHQCSNKRPIRADRFWRNSARQFAFGIFSVGADRIPKGSSIEMEGYGFCQRGREYKVEALLFREIGYADDKDAPAGEGRSSNLGWTRRNIKPRATPARFSCDA